MIYEENECETKRDAQAVVAKVEGDVNEEYTNASASRPSSQEDLTVPQDPARLRQELSDARETIQRMQQQIERYSQSGSHGDGKVMTAVVPVNNAGYPAYVIALVSFLVFILTWYFA